MEIIGYIASLFIGISLGLIGGGGSVLTVPVLVYLFGVEPVLATAYSLFIVGATSLVGAYPKYKSGEVNMRTALIFGAPSIAAVFATRAFVVPAIPAQITNIGDFALTKSLLLMLLFAVMMIVASFSMIRGNGKNKQPYHQKKVNYPLILIEGAVVGSLTGLVGAGGGFLIIPALVLLTSLPMKEAIGTSLVIIAAKSLIGFAGDLRTQTMDWDILLSVTALAIVGIFAGNIFAKKVSGDHLKKGFGWFVLAMGIYIIISEVI